MTSYLRICVAAIFASVALTGHAFAHAHLKYATPPMGGTVAAPSELNLTFSEGFDLRFTGVKITGPDGKVVATGRASLGVGGGAVLVVPVSSPLPAGPYTVDWHALATDGHKSNGTYTFTVKP